MKNSWYLVAAIMTCSAPAFASEAMTSEGLWLKGSIAATSAAYGSQATIFDTNGNDYSVTSSVYGVAPDLRLSVGKVVAPDWVLQANVGINRLAEPEYKYELDGEEIESGSFATTSQLLSVTAGTTRYFGAASVTGRIGYASWSEKGTKSTTDIGSGVLYGVGVDYDFFTSSSVRAGLGFSFDLATLTPDDNENYDIGYSALGLVLNGTFF